MLRQRSDRQPRPASEFAAYALLCLIWGTTWLAVRIAVEHVPPFRAAAARFIIAAGLLGLVCLIRRTRLPCRSEWRAVLVLSLTIMAGPYAIIFWAEQYVASGATAVIFATVPTLVALLTPLMTHQRVPARAIGFLVVGLGGIGVLMWRDMSHGQTQLTAGVMVMIAVCMSSWSTVYAKRELHDLDPGLSTALQLFFGFFFLAGASVIAESGRPSDWSARAIAATLFLAVAGSAVAFGLYYWLLKRWMAYKVTSLDLVMPVIAVFEGWLFLGEPLTGSMVIAAATVIGSVAMVLRMEAEQRHG